MSDVTRILSQIESGDPSAAEQWESTIAALVTSAFATAVQADKSTALNFQDTWSISNSQRTGAVSLRPFTSRKNQKTRAVVGQRHRNEPGDL